MGVDPALKVTGIGIIDSLAGRCAVVSAGVIVTPEKQDTPRRLATIHEQTLRLIRTHRPDVMAIEKIFVHAHHPLTAFQLGQARGIICLAAAQCHLPLAEFAATQVKKAVVGRGQASKEQIQRMVTALLGLKRLPRYMDITDALALALTYRSGRGSDPRSRAVNTGHL